MTAETAPVTDQFPFEPVVRLAEDYSTILRSIRDILDQTGIPTDESLTGRDMLQALADRLGVENRYDQIKQGVTSEREAEERKRYDDIFEQYRSVYRANGIPEHLHEAALEINMLHLFWSMSRTILNNYNMSASSRFEQEKEFQETVSRIETWFEKYGDSGIVEKLHIPPLETFLQNSAY